jgi:hypothetical protein
MKIQSPADSSDSTSLQYVTVQDRDQIYAAANGHVSHYAQVGEGSRVRFRVRCRAALWVTFSLPADRPEGEWPTGGHRD